MRARFHLALALALGACGGDPSTGGVDATSPDAGVDAGIDAPGTSACEASIAIDTLPVTYQGDLAGAGADLISPSSCAVIDAPFGVSSAGADMVLSLDGLQAGLEYVVKLSSAGDLGFYVVTGCSGDAGPAAAECLLFVDATVEGAEVGRFVADAPSVYVVVDYYEAGEPLDTDFTLEVYAEECEEGGDDCTGDAPFCQDGRCVGCASDFDCDDPSLPLCDEPTYACVPGHDFCTGDDAAENGDDGPAGAPTLVPGPARAGAICNNPATERDFLRFHVDDPGEHWQIALDWGSSVDLDLIVYDADGQLMGMSFYEQPEMIELTYLPAGDYYAMVDYYASSTTSLSQSYTVQAQRLVGDACTGADDCAAEYRNQVFRGTCASGACERIVGDGAVVSGARCDSVSDCAEGTNCASFFFTADADTRMVCGDLCESDGECLAALGPGYVCTDYLVDNFCVQECSYDDQCPTVPTSYPDVPPWLRFTCDVPTGRCLPP